MRSADLLKTADLLVLGVAQNKRPRQSDLRRAVSTVYYAMFHCLARCCADTLVGGPNAAKSKYAWRQAYRALEHGSVRKGFPPDTLNKFPDAMQDFVDNFNTLQKKRNFADYDPFEKFYKMDVQNDIIVARTIIAKFERADRKDRRAFAAVLLLKKRSDK